MFSASSDLALQIEAVYISETFISTSKTKVYLPRILQSEDSPP
jgi:hypothetical protein